MKFEFPITTEYHPANLTMDEHSLLREGWLGQQTAPRPVSELTLNGNYENPVWGLRFRHTETGQMRFSIVGNASTGGWWYHNLNRIASDRPYQYVQLAQVHGFEMEGRTGDYTTVRRMFIALRNDGKLDLFVDGVSTTPHYAITQPDPPTLIDNHTYTPENLVEWEEAFLVAVAVPKSHIMPAVIRSPASNMVRIFHNPQAITALDITLTHPDPDNHNFFVYIFKAGQAFFVDAFIIPFTFIIIPKNEDLYLKAVNFRFVANNKDVFEGINEKINGMLSLGDRMVYWGSRGVYISSRNHPFLFGTEEGYTPADGDGGFVALPNVLFCVDVGSTILAFTPKKVYRIVEAGQGIWVAIEADYIPPALINDKPVWRGFIYRTSTGYVDVGGGEQRPFGGRFKLLDLRQIDGTAELGMGVDANGEVWVWLGDDIHKLYNETADFIFVDAGKAFLLSGTSSSLTIKSWEPVGWVATGSPKYSKWVYQKSFPSEVYFERLLIRLIGISSLVANITVQNFDNPAEQVQVVNTTLYAGMNTVILPKRLRASVFRITIEAGQPNGTADYIMGAVGEVRALERLKGAIKR